MFAVVNAKNRYVRTSPPAAPHAPERSLRVPCCRRSTRPGPPGPRSAATDGGEEVTRFSGWVGDAFIQVTGSPVTVTVNHTADDHMADELIIRSNDITVRIRQTGGERH